MKEENLPKMTELYTEHGQSIHVEDTASNAVFCIVRTKQNYGNWFTWRNTEYKATRALCNRN